MERILAATLGNAGATDFFTAEVWTPRGLVTFYVLFVIELASRRGHIAGIATQPDGPWMAQVARELTGFDGCLQGKSHLIMERDTKFTEKFRTMLSDSGVKPVLLPPRSPNLNAFAERFVRTIKEECLARMILIGERMLRRCVTQFTLHYNTERSHQGIDNRIIDPVDDLGKLDGDIVCRERLGGLLKYYHRQAA